MRMSSLYYYNAKLRPDAPHVVLQLSLGGVGYYRRHGQPKQLLPAGRAWLDRIPGNFEYGWESGSHELVFVTMRGPIALDWMRRIHARFGPILSLEDPPHNSPILQSMMALVRSPPRDRYLLSGQLYGLLMQLISELSRGKLAESPLITRAITTLQSHAASADFNVTDLAKQLDISREHLAREFKEATGLTPLDYLTQERVRLAARELRAGGGKLDRIARQSGFASAQYFCRAFRKATGVTPGQFRERQWLIVP